MTVPVLVSRVMVRKYPESACKKISLTISSYPLCPEMVTGDDEDTYAPDENTGLLACDTLGVLSACAGENDRIRNPSEQMMVAMLSPCFQFIDVSLLCHDQSFITLNKKRWFFVGFAIRYKDRLRWGLYAVGTVAVFVCRQRGCSRGRNHIH